MAGYSARQSSFTTGDTILAAHSNDEFNQVLAAFNATTGHSHDGTAGEGGPVSTLRDADSLNKILVDTSNNHLEFYVEVSSAAVQQLRIQDGAIVPITDNDIDLGTSSLEFKDLFIDGTANVDAINLDGTLITSTAAELNILDGVTATAAELNILDGVTSTAAELNILDGVTATAAELNIMDGVTSTTAELNILDGVTSTASELNLVDGITAGTVSASKAVIVDSNKDLTGFRNLTISGDLTVSGDDITMGTNTAGNLLVADGTNFNSIAVGDLSEISTVANDDVFLAIDTSGGGLKKIARSAVVSGLATSGAISNVVEDTTPQLGGNLDMNGQDIVTTSNANIELAPNGTGTVVIKGNTNQGALVLNCESNSHGQKIQPQPHSVGSNAVHTLPDVTAELVPGKTGGTNFTNSILVGHATTGSLNNAIGNVGVGVTALDALATADNNVAVGFGALSALASGSQNVAVGQDALTVNNSGSENTAVGGRSSRLLANGTGNTTVGYNAGTAMNNADADYNILVGHSAGDNITEGAGNVIIGSVDAAAADGDRTLKIAGYDGSTTTTWISGDSSGNITVPGTVTANGETLSAGVSAGFAVAMAIAL